jgi:hypothetical protein
MKPTGQMNTLGCHRVMVTEKGKSALTHIFSAETTTTALWLYNQLIASDKYAKVRLMDSSGHQWVVGLRVDARLMKEDEKPSVIFEDPELERIHGQLYLEQ